MRHINLKYYGAILTSLLLIAQVSMPVMAATAPAQSKPATTTKAEPQPEEYTVRGIGVEGLKKVPTQVVLGVIKKTVVGEKLNPDAVRDDLQSIIDTGYFSDVEAKLQPEGDGVKVVFLPTENEVVGSFNIETTVLEPTLIRKYFAQKDGEVLNVKQLKEDIESLQDRVINDHGFVVRPSSVSVEDGEVHVAIDAIKVSGIDVRGNEKTRENVIRRELTIKPGDNLNMSRLGLDLRRVLHLGFFDEVRPIFEQNGENPDQVNLAVEVVERKTGSAAFGAGYSSLDGLLGYVEYAEDNFLGRGERFSARTEFGQKKTSYDLGFQEPYLFGSKTSFGINLYNRSYDRIKFDKNTEIGYKEYGKGGDMSIGRPLGEYTSGRITLKVADTSIIPKVEGSMPEENTRTRSLIFQSNTDTTDHPFYPLKGMRANLSVESAGLFLGGDTRFMKYIGETSRYFKVGHADQVLAFRLVGGIAQAQNTLPTQEEFRVGGADTVRGYKYGEMHGDRMVYMNSEYRFKVAKSLQAALFVDAGQAWNNSQGGPDKLKVGYGAGLRLDTPLGIMRLDYGVGEKGGSAFFSLGPSF